MRKLTLKQKELIKEYYEENCDIKYEYFTNSEYLAYSELIEKLEEVNNYRTINVNAVDKLLWDLKTHNNVNLETWG